MIQLNRNCFLTCLVTLALSGLPESLPAATTDTADLVVAADGSGDFLKVQDADQQDVSFIVPVDGDTGDSIHIVCEVTDTGTPALTRYQRVVVEIE